MTRFTGASSGLLLVYCIYILFLKEREKELKMVQWYGPSFLFHYKRWKEAIESQWKGCKTKERKKKAQWRDGVCVFGKLRGRCEEKRERLRWSSCDHFLIFYASIQLPFWCFLHFFSYLIFDLLAITKGGKVKVKSHDHCRRVSEKSSESNCEWSSGKKGRQRVKQTHTQSNSPKLPPGFLLLFMEIERNWDGRRREKTGGSGREREQSRETVQCEWADQGTKSGARIEFSSLFPMMMQLPFLQQAEEKEQEIENTLSATPTSYDCESRKRRRKRLLRSHSLCDRNSLCV